MECLWQITSVALFICLTHQIPDGGYRFGRWHFQKVEWKWILFMQRLTSITGFMVLWKRQPQISFVVWTDPRPCSDVVPWGITCCFLLCPRGELWSLLCGSYCCSARSKEHANNQWSWILARHKLDPLLDVIWLSFHLATELNVLALAAGSIHLLGMSTESILMLGIRNALHAIATYVHRFRSDKSKFMPSYGGK